MYFLEDLQLKDSTQTKVERLHGLNLPENAKYKPPSRERLPLHNLKHRDLPAFLTTAETKIGSTFNNQTDKQNKI